MRSFRHMVRGRPLNSSCPVVDVLYPHMAPFVCCVWKGGESVYSMMAADAESMRRKRLQNMAILVRKNIGSGPQPERL